MNLQKHSFYVLAVSKEVHMWQSFRTRVSDLASYQYVPECLYFFSAPFTLTEKDYQPIPWEISYMSYTVLTITDSNHMKIVAWKVPLPDGALIVWRDVVTPFFYFSILQTRGHWHQTMDKVNIVHSEQILLTKSFGSSRLFESIFSSFISTIFKLHPSKLSQCRKNFHWG